MSNNIMDTVAQAVNSLVSALKLPDESAKANDTLGSMNFPQFSRTVRAVSSLSRPATITCVIFWP